MGDWSLGTKGRGRQGWDKVQSWLFRDMAAAAVVFGISVNPFPDTIAVCLVEGDRCVASEGREPSSITEGRGADEQGFFFQLQKN